MREGSDLSIISYGAMVHQAAEAATRLAQDGIEAEVLDLRTLKPLDEEAILAAARKSGKVLIVHSATKLVGVGAEVAALISERAFEWLDAPIVRMGGLDVPVPFSPPLEDAYRPSAEKIYQSALELARF
jgi:2-oxoisovalerate dehydrogenase E1 component beta subunit